MTAIPEHWTFSPFHWRIWTWLPVSVRPSLTREFLERHMTIRARELKAGDRFAFDGVHKAYQALEVIVPNTASQRGYLEYREIPGAGPEGLPIVTELERFQQQVIG